MDGRTHAFVTPSIGLGAPRLNRLELRERCQTRLQDAVTSRRRCQVTMRVLDGLDTETQQPYTFSRYILGPYRGIDTIDRSGEEERELAIRAAYRQVFGNAYLMEEERAELAVVESQYKLGAFSAKELVRAMAKSSAYRTRFFEGASQYRFIELNFKHLLGRSPDSQEEISTHVRLYAAKGYDAEIDSYIDSEEYFSLFGMDLIPFLRFRGAYTPCDSFNKQCALEGGWANSDKAMGGAALSGYNGLDGRQMSSLISSYAAKAPTPYETVAANTPLKSTAPNWYACPDPALPPEPAFVSVAEVSALRRQVAALENQYNMELERKNNGGKNQLNLFRHMARDIGANDRGFAFSGGLDILSNPFARQLGDESPLSLGGSKASDFQRFGASMECDNLSRLEKLLEEARSELRVLDKALAKSTPVSPTLNVPGQIDSTFMVRADVTPKGERPRIRTVRTEAKQAAKKTAPKPTEALKDEKIKIGPVTVPQLDIKKVSSLLSDMKMPDVNLPDIKLPDVRFPWEK